MKMKTKPILWSLLLFLPLFAMAAQTKTYKTIKDPAVMACVNVRDGELKAREVILTDTATTVHFTMVYTAGQPYRFVSESYLIDEDGNRYPLRSAEGIALDAWVQSPESGVTDFTMHFQPMPKRVQMFDFIEGDVRGAFMLLGIHDKKYKMKVPTLQQLYAANPYTLPSDWLKTDTITIRGRIEGYDAGLFGFTSMECFFEDVFEQNSTTLVLEIAPDGSFEKAFQVSCPVQNKFITYDNKVDFYEMPFFARPGETIDITVKKGTNGKYECIYNNGSSRDVQRWLRNAEQFYNLTSQFHSFKGSVAEANQMAETLWSNLLCRLQSVSRREQFTPLEMQLALANVQTDFAYAYLDYFMYREFDLMKQEFRDGVYYTEILDSAEWKAIHDEKNYMALHRIGFDNPVLHSADNYHILLNRMQFAMPVRDFTKLYTPDENGEYIINVQNEIRALNNSRTSLRDIMGTDKDNLMVQMCTYKDMLSDFNSWRNNEEAVPMILTDTTMTEAERKKGAENMVTLSKMYPLYLATYSNPYIRGKAEQFYAKKMAQTDLSSPLPDAPMADLIHNLCAKYPGRYLMIDFWGMGCGPCRLAIEHSKNLRAEIAQRDDVKLVFIAGERTTEGSDAYKNYVKEWLADEETICLTNADYTRLQELFQFNGIPHYETITPEGRRVRDDLRLNGFHNFDQEMKRLKERLE